LWEYAAALPLDLRLHRGGLKAILRELARRRIGERVARGRKRGFGIPAGRWMAGRWRARVEETLRDSILDREGWIDGQAALKKFAREVEAGEASLQTWYLFVLETWMRHERGANVFEPPADDVERLTVATLRARETTDAPARVVAETKAAVDTSAPAVAEAGHAQALTEDSRAKALAEDSHAA
jgi:hypothetical protein